MKILCVLLPHFPLYCELSRNSGLQEHPAVLTRASGSQKLVLDYSPRLTGLQRDMPLQQALSLHGDVTLVQADIPYYQAVFKEILDALELKSPLVEGDDSGIIYIGLDGLQMIYRDDSHLIAAVRECVPGIFSPRLGIAQGKFPAYLAALYSQPHGCRILNGDLEAFLRDLSCDVLPVSMKNKTKLKEFGILTLGQAAALPAGPLLSQFGPEGQKIRELAAGHDDTPLRPRLTEEKIEERAVLNSITVSLEALLFSYENMLAHIFSRIAVEGLGLRSFTLWTRTWGGEYWERKLRFKEPAMDIKTAAAKIKQLLESDPQPGPVERLGIRVTGLGRRSGKQRSLLSDIRARENLLNDIQSLEQRLGSPQVFKIKEVEPWSRIPERRYALTPLNR